MSFWDIFRKKSERKEGLPADANAGFVPLTTATESDSSETEITPHGGSGDENATGTDSGAGSFGGDGGDASGGDGGSAS